MTRSRGTSRGRGKPEHKTDLTFHEAIRAVYLHYILGLDQATITIALNVSNQGRVNEVCVAVRRALREQPYNKEDAPNGQGHTEPTHPDDPIATPPA